MSPQQFSSPFPSASSGASSVVTPLFRQPKELKPKDGFKKEGMRKQHLALTNRLEQGLNLKSSWNFVDFLLNNETF